MNPRAVQDLQDIKLNNDQFFNEMGAHLPSLINENITKMDIESETRLKVKLLLEDMKKANMIEGIIHWTAQEQAKFFQRVQSELAAVRETSSDRIRDVIRSLIERELWDEEHQETSHFNLEDGSGNIVFANIHDRHELDYFLRTSFLGENVRLLPINLYLTITEQDNTDLALHRLDELYRGKYNALVMIDEANHVVGLLPRETLLEWKSHGHEKLQGISVVQHAQIHYTTSLSSVLATFQEHGVNILPVVDSTTGMILGIITDEHVMRRGYAYYSTASLTDLKLRMIKEGS
jgi:hypothetical protein